MNQNQTLLHEDLIFLNYEAKSKEELLQSLSSILRERGYVKDSYTKGVLEREKVFPTGLNTEGIKVAIPHTDVEHVNEAAILIAKLKEPVVFKEMGSGINDVEAKLIFMMAIKNPEDQVKALSKLMSIFSNKEVLISLHNCTTNLEAMDILSKVLDNSGQNKSMKNKVV